MAIQRSRNVPNEQPPVHDPERLREWLSRMMILINGALDSLMIEAPDTASVGEGERWIQANQISGTPVYTWAGIGFSDPILGQIKGNSLILANITELRISNTASNGLDTGFILSKVDAPNIIYTSLFTSENTFVGFEVTGPSVNDGAFHTIPVTAVTSQGIYAIEDQIKINLQTFFWPVRDNHYLEEMGPYITSNQYGISPVTTLDETITTLADTYDVTICFDVSSDVNNRSVVVALFIDGVMVEDELNLTMAKPGDHTFISKFYYYTFTAGSHDIRIDFGKAGGGGGALVYIEHIRVKVEQRWP